MNLLYWLVITVLILAIPLALITGAVLVLELVRRPAPVRPARAAAQHRAPRGEREPWIQDTLPTRTPQAPAGPWFDDVEVDRARPYTNGIHGQGGQAIIS